MSDETTFLLVDDQTNVIEVLTNHLTELGFTGKIFTANNGQEGYLILEKQLRSDYPIEFIISDVTMPLVNGIEFIRKIRGSGEQFKNIPVLLLTNEKEKITIIDALKAGTTNYLMKPWNKTDLLNKISYCYEKHND